MKFTLSWLKRHLRTTATSKEIEKTLSMIGLEVESCVDKGLIYKDFIIAKIEDSYKHQDSEKLNICKVNNGKEILQIVCGGANARAGIKVVLAPVGAKIPSNGLEIKAAKIRGVESNGMLCSSDELMIEGDNKGIIELPEDAQIGGSFAEYAKLNDVEFDISITPNRGDAASVYGIARDLAAAGVGELIFNEQKAIETYGATNTSVIIEEKAACNNFMLRLIKGVNNKQTGSYPSSYMRSIGSSPKSALVDISNFAMMEYGRPNHIYDADKVVGNIVIRNSKEGEKFTPISGEEMELPDGILVVADSTGPIAIAGVMGGESTKVTEETKNILIELAVFSPKAVSQSGRALGLLSDSRFRFERRVDCGNAEMFNNFLTNLIVAECGGEAHEEIIAAGESEKKIEKIDFDFSYIEQLSGLPISKESAVTILNKLGFKISGTSISIPSYRQGDVQSKADIVEEVVRIYGLDKIQSKDLPFSQNELSFNTTDFIDQAKVKCAALGYNEVVSWAFVSAKTSSLFGFTNTLELMNPISSELVIMRQSIIPSLLDAYMANNARGVEDISLFEVASLFFKDASHSMNRSIAGVRVGKLNRKTSFKDERAFDFYDVKADVYALISLYGLDPEKLQIRLDAPSYYHPGKSCSFYLGKTLIATCGELHPVVKKNLDISNTVVMLEINVDRLPAMRVKNAKQKLVLSNFQKVNRDFAFLVKNETSAGEIVSLIKGADKNLIESVNIFDIYQGEKVETGRKSVALSVTLAPADRTLSDGEINDVSKKIIDEVTIKLNASLR